MLRSMIDVVPSAALAVDAKGRIVCSNARAALLFGYASTDMTGMLVDVLVHPSQDKEGVAPIGRSWVTCAAAGSTKRAAIVRKKEGEQGDVQVTSSVSFAVDNARYAVVVIEPAHDDAMSATEPVFRSDGPARRHREQDCDVGDKAAALAHEVDQPLTAILSNAQAARRFLAIEPLNKSELFELLGEIVSDSARAHAIVRKMRKFGKREQTEMGTIDMSRLVRDVMQLLHRRATECDVSLSSHIENGLPLLHGDAVQLQQVLVNLIINAFDAVLDSVSDDREVFVHVCPMAGVSGVHIAVRDRGMGVSDEQLAILFKPFSTSKPDGMGLGLSISRIIVTVHGGRLWAERNADRGMTFHIELPAEGATMNTAVRERP
ncbi:PAS domain-containing sensor histidine kinase [Paraburkholderia dinghuensis]|uniref:PAS domain-containing sensor histidine kinase n=1 Tax=Paraburkholderia dinghuensis TaxID=2305225 RepID=UPI0016290AD0|nr:ATP-binding protein [Paraburkholderia dinghuensis]